MIVENVSSAKLTEVPHAGGDLGGSEPYMRSSCVTTKSGWDRQYDPCLGWKSQDLLCVLTPLEAEASRGIEVMWHRGIKDEASSMLPLQRSVA